MEYRLCRGIDDPPVFALQEKWRSRADLNGHFEMPYMKEWANRRDQFVAKRELLMLNQVA